MPRARKNLSSRPKRAARSGGTCFFKGLVLLIALTTATRTLEAHAQNSIGSVKTEGTQVAGNVSVRDGRATIGTSAAVTAGTQTAEVTLTRGGSVKVCAGSVMHVSIGTMAVKKPPVMVALDRGSIEIHTAALKTDAILTPDMRFELSDAAPLDLRIRVVPNGDTCVENAGKDAPMLHITETFGDGTFFVRPGQHVLFEHGSLREVVDHESSPCGCPKGDGLVLAGKGKKGDGNIPEAARTNPFPEAVSQGLAAPSAPQPPSSTGEEHVQVSSTLAYAGTTNTVTGPPGQATTSADVAATSAEATAPAAPVASTPRQCKTSANPRTRRASRNQRPRRKRSAATRWPQPIQGHRPLLQKTLRRQVATGLPTWPATRRSHFMHKTG